MNGRRGPCGGYGERLVAMENFRLGAAHRWTPHEAPRPTHLHHPLSLLLSLSLLSFPLLSSHSLSFSSLLASPSLPLVVSTAVLANAHYGRPVPLARWGIVRRTAYLPHRRPCHMLRLDFASSTRNSVCTVAPLLHCTHCLPSPGSTFQCPMSSHIMPLTCQIGLTLTYELYIGHIDIGLIVHESSHLSAPTAAHNL